MNKYISWLRGKDWFYASILLVVGMIAYLLFVNRLGLYLDDWFLIFDAHTQGPEFMRVIFQSDRPLRGYFMEFIYFLFGDHLIYYHLASFLFRYLGILILFFTLNILWENRKIENFWISLLTLVYPPFIDQVHSVDFISHIFSLFLAILSIALTVFAILSKKKIIYTVLSIIAIITGWIYLGLIEYHIGLEFLRLFFVFIVSSKSDQSFSRTFSRFFLRYVPYLIIPVGFLVWRTFYFQSLPDLPGAARDATNLGLQLQPFFQSPVYIGSGWIKSMLFSMFNSLLAGWVVPFYNYQYSGVIRLRDTLWIYGLVIVATAFVYMAVGGKKNQIKESISEQTKERWLYQVIWGGILTVFSCLMPIIIANRTATIGEMGRYLIAGAPGAAMVIVAIISLFPNRTSRVFVSSVMLFLSLSSQLFNTVDHVQQTDSLRDFWWQVSWRVPQIQPATTLVVSYLVMWAPEEHVIWGPANLIFYPKKQHTYPINITLPAILPDELNIDTIMSDEDSYVRDRRGNTMTVSFDQMLVITQSIPNTCIHIIDGNAPELVPEDSLEITFFSSYSNLDNIVQVDKSIFPPRLIFGDEPDHTWCYYYQKAALALQGDNWSSVISLVEEAREKGYGPNTTLEWLPLLQAYVATGKMDELKPYISIMAVVPLIHLETCQILTQTAENIRPDDAAMKNYIQSNFCSGG